ncbi:MAG: peroxiredoxin, partial [Polyangiales bacterium]
LTPGVRIAHYVAAGMSLMLFSTWLFLMATRKTPASTLKVRIGDSVLPFVTPRSDGTTFDVGSLQGKRYLLKFFRGAWCPYCSAELKRFDELSPLLQERNIDFVALSKDDPEAAAKQVLRDGLRFPLLSDPELKVIRQYGVEHHKAIEFSKVAFTVFGMPLALVPSVKTMAIPTTLLIDEEGIVRWIDQTDDYRLRSSEERVLQAIDEVFGPPNAAA